MEFDEGDESSPLSTRSGSGPTEPANATVALATGEAVQKSARQCWGWV